jgi:hypothetical protein
MMIQHKLEIVLPWVGKEVSVEDRHQPADLREVVTHLSLWSGVTIATTI